MPVGTRKIRRAFVLQAVVASLVVAGCMLSLARMDSSAPFAVWLAIGLATLAISVAAWVGHNITRRTLEPVNWLLRQVSRWEPHKPDTQSLSPEQIPADVRGAPRELALAVHELGQRVTDFIARERDFTRDASHELRTPLTVIALATEMISQDAGLSEQSRSSLARVQGAVSSMEALVDALLMLARDGGLMPAGEDFAVRDVVEHEVEAIRPWLGGKPVEIELEVEAEPVLHAPPRALGVMLGSLLSNAARFTESGCIRVRLRGDRVEVEDTGIGMDAAALARATDPFYRAEPGRKGGPGLGLSIAHRLGRRCGWPLQLDSVPGHGTRASILFAPQAS